MNGLASKASQSILQMRPLLHFHCLPLQGTGNSSMDWYYTAISTVEVLAASIRVETKTSVSFDAPHMLHGT